MSFRGESRNLIQREDVFKPDTTPAFHNVSMQCAIYFRPGLDGLVMVRSVILSDEAMF